MSFAVSTDRRATVAVMRGVSKTFDGYQTYAVRDISFEVRRGEVFGLAGAPEAGKSTALRLLAGRLAPTQGQVKVFGRSPRWGFVKSRIGYLSLDAHRSQSRGGLRGWFGRRDSDRTWAAAVPAAASKDRMLRAQLAARNCELVILDAPLAGLDAEGLHELREFLLELAQRGQTVILSLESLASVRGLCHRVAILHRGEMQAVGSLDDLLALADAIRFLGPVLPPATSGQVMECIRANLGGGEVYMPAATKNPKPIAEKPKVPPADREDAFLTALSQRSVAPPVLNPTVTGVDPVNHDLLAGLMRPAIKDGPSSAEK